MISRALKLAALAAAAIYLLLWAGWNGADWPVAYWPGRFLHLPAAGWLALALLGGMALAVAVQSVSDTLAQFRRNRQDKAGRRRAESKAAIQEALHKAREGAFKSAMRALQRELDGPEAGEALITIARLQMDEGRLEEAGQSLDRARAMGRPSAGLSIRLARQFKRRRDWSGAESYLNRALEVRPDDPEVERLLVELAAARRDWDTAVRRQRARLERLDDHAAPAERERMAWLLWERGSELAGQRLSDEVEKIARELERKLGQPRLAEDLRTQLAAPATEKEPLAFACRRCEERFAAWRAVCPACHSPDSFYHRNGSPPDNAPAKTAGRSNGVT